MVVFTRSSYGTSNIRYTKEVFKRFATSTFTGGCEDYYYYLFQLLYYAAIYDIYDLYDIRYAHTDHNTAIYSTSYTNIKHIWITTS